jgi:hypothetical protein
LPSAAQEDGITFDHADNNVVAGNIAVRSSLILLCPLRRLAQVY